MTRVTLAVEHEGYAPDSTIDLPRYEARVLLDSGRARLATDSAQSTTKVLVARPATDGPSPSQLG